ncbi:hypothetical protein [Streptomyces geysiriensis]|uniref:hypothetical protein n=1 Tax=Streptomyces geysiriensis TaxID=68207 RepID=UPI001C7D0C98|nr:hypothetical protein [Streptomyces geysiriensis]MBX4179038.1 hypothetical protein [Streptomyces geysiriensis]
MSNHTRVLALTVAGAAALLASAATPASAVPDPVGLLTCATESAGDVTALLDPAGPAAPEVPLTSCLAP